jgi:hypothetical protein
MRNFWILNRKKKEELAKQVPKHLDIRNIVILKKLLGKTKWQKNATKTP